MLRHVVVMTFSADTTDDQREALRSDLLALPDSIPEILGYSVGLDAGFNDTNADLVVVGDFADRPGFDAYMQHPDHDRVRTELGKHAVSAVRIQYEL